MFKIFKKKTKDDAVSKSNEKKDKNIITNKVHVRVLRSENNTPVESYDFYTGVELDENGNRIIQKSDLTFKEELSYIREPLISDILFKIKHRLSNKNEQISKLKSAIEKQEDFINSIKNGRVKKKDKKEKNSEDLLSDEFEDLEKEDQKKETEIKVNIISEKVKLNLLKVSLYTLENEGDGSFIRIGNDGIRILEYHMDEGDLDPVFWKAPKLKGEPVTVYVDKSQKKKYWKEADRMIDDDFANSTQSPFRGILILILWAFFTILLLGNIFLYAENLSRAKELDKLSNDNVVNRIMKDVEEVNKQCAMIMGQIIEEQKPLVDYAKNELNKSISKNKEKTVEI